MLYVISNTKLNAGMWTRMFQVSSLACFGCIICVNWNGLV